MADNSKVMKCNCVNNFQDQRYGVGMRVFNKGSKAWRCATCKREVPFAAADNTVKAESTTQTKPKKK